MFGGLNSYAYGLGNPMKYVDPWGLWSTAAHEYLIRRYGERNGLTEAQIQDMMRGSRYADSLPFQDDDHSYMHAMSSDSLSRGEACGRANQFIQDGLFNPRHRPGRSNRNRNGTYFNRGMGMHTVMDSTSPAHQGFQHWSNDQIPRHGPDSFMGIDRNHTEEGLTALLDNPGLIEQTLNLMDDAMNGAGLNCGCSQ